MGNQNTRQQNTEFVGQELASKMHRKLGDPLYGHDIDMLDYTFDRNDKIVFSAITDYKYPSKKTIWSGHKCFAFYTAVAKQFAIPFFIILTYIGPEHKHGKMFYIIPGNQLALNYVQKDGKWFSVKGYSKFLHNIRGVEFDETMKLSDKFVSYSLPNIQITIPE